MKFILDYIDLITIVAGLVATILAGIRIARLSRHRLRKGVVPVLFFGPVFIITTMATHLLEVSWHVIDTRFSGAFSYSFHLYSLYLLPAVLIYAAWRFYKNAVQFCLAPMSSKKSLLLSFAVITIICAPAVKIVPVAAVPIVASAISIIASFFTRKTNKVITRQEAAPGDMIAA